MLANTLNLCPQSPLLIQVYSNALQSLDLLLSIDFAGYDIIQIFTDLAQIVLQLDRQVEKVPCWSKQLVQGLLPVV